MKLLKCIPIALLCSCASSGLVKPSQEDLNLAIEGYRKCLSIYARHLDDRTSDATTIADAIAASCVSERERFIDAHGRKSLDNQEQLEIFKRNLRKDRSARKEALLVVLKQRKLN